MVKRTGRGPQRLSSEWWCWLEDRDECEGRCCEGWGPVEAAEAYSDALTDEGDYEPSHRVIFVREASREGLEPPRGTGAEVCVVDVEIILHPSSHGRLREGSHD